MVLQKSKAIMGLKVKKSKAMWCSIKLPGWKNHTNQ